MGVLQHGRFILRWCGTPFLTKRCIHNRMEIENRLVLGSKIILKNWAKRAVWGIGLAVCVGCVIVIIKFAGKTENKTITVNSAETINPEDATAIRRGRNRLLLPSEVVLEWYYDLGIQ